MPSPIRWRRDDTATVSASASAATKLWRQSWELVEVRLHHGDSLQQLPGSVMQRTRVRSWDAVLRAMQIMVYIATPIEEACVLQLARALLLHTCCHGIVERRSSDPDACRLLTRIAMALRRRLSWDVGMGVGTRKGVNIEMPSSSAMDALALLRQCQHLLASRQCQLSWPLQRPLPAPRVLEATCGTFRLRLQPAAAAAAVPS